MIYVYIIGIICFGGLLLLFNHLDNESPKAKGTGVQRDTSNDGCINSLFKILLVGGLIVYVIINLKMCSDSNYNDYDSDYEYYEPRHSD